MPIEWGNTVNTSEEATHISNQNAERREADLLYIKIRNTFLLYEEKNLK
jgi:hypothetical protein